MAEKKPIRVFCTNLTDHWEFWASQHYKELTDDDGNVTGYVITGAKYNVTQDIANAIVKNDIEFIPAAPEDDRDS